MSHIILPISIIKVSISIFKPSFSLFFAFLKLARKHNVINQLLGCLDLLKEESKRLRVMLLDVDDADLFVLGHELHQMGGIEIYL